MKNFRLGAITGIPVYANITLVVFIPVLGWLLSRSQQIELYAQLIEGLVPYTFDVGVLQSGNTPLIIGTVGAVALMASVLVHELGHSWTARHYDVEIASITLWIFGGMAHMTELPEEWNKEFWIALAGPVTSVVLAVGAFGVLQVVPESPLVVFLVGWFAVVNLSLAIFNMVPAFPMDGGRILRALLARSRPYAAATQTAARVAKFLAVAMAVLGIFAGGPMLVLIALFVYVAATSESRATVLRELLRGFTVRELMQTDVHSVRPETTVRELRERVLSERHTWFPVVDDGGDIRGTVTLDDLQRAESETRLEDVMKTEPATLSPDADAFEVVVAMGEHNTDHVLVVENDSLVGVISAADLLEAIEILEGVGVSDRRPPVPDGYA
jgi:Zn-dependent protease/predicted transcriptional regulator